MSELNEDLTLKELIDASFAKASSRAKLGKEAEQEAKSMCDWFETYYGGTADGSELWRVNILNTPLHDIRKNEDDFIAKIEDGIRSYPRDKARQAAKLGKLIRNLNEKYQLQCDEQFLNKFEQQDRSLRQLEILKYLHAGGKSRDDIAEHFDISKRQLDDDLKTLHEGIEFMGTEMKIPPLKRKENTYESPIHPVFLALNSAEIYALTIGLKLLSENTVFQEPLSRIADHIHMQLSDFARELVDSQPEAEEITFNKGQRKFLSSAQMIGDYDRPFCQYIKSQKTCHILYLSEGAQKEVSGTIHLPPKGADRFKSIYVKGPEESIIIPIDHIVSIC